MIVNTKSIKDIIEIELNKKIEDVQIEDLKSITYLRINRLGTDDFLDVDSNEILLFPNLEELSIEKCMIDNKIIDCLKKIKVKKINFIQCEFVDECKDFFDNLSLEELVLNNVEGLDNYAFSNINKLKLINCSFIFMINNVNSLDISRSEKIKIDLNNILVNELIISEKQYLDGNYPKCKIIVKNNYDEIIKVIENG